MSKNPKYQNLTRDQQIQRDILMYAFDVSLLENDPTVVNRGILRADAVDSDGVTRDTYENQIIDALLKGGSIAATYPETFRSIQEERNVSFDFSGSEIDLLPSAKSGKEEDYAKIDDMIVTLYHEYREYGSVPVVPFDTTNNDRTHYGNLGMQIDASDLGSVNLYTAEPSNRSSAIPGRVLVRTALDEQGEWNVDGAQTFVPAGFNSNFEALIANRAVYDANEFVREYNKAVNGMPMSISDAQKLRDYIRFSRNDATTVEEARQFVINRTQEFLINEGIINDGPDASFAEYLEQKAQSGQISPLIDDEAADVMFDRVRNITVSGFRVVDTFGYTEVGGTMVPTASLESVHAFINADRDAQLESIDKVSEAHMLGGKFSEDVKDRQSDAIYNQFMITQDDYLVEKGGLLFHTNGTHIISPRAEKQSEAEVASVSSAFVPDANMAVGLAETTNDKVGISRLRKYIKTEDYKNLSIEIGDSFNEEASQKAMDSAERILEYLNSEGILYTVEQDAKATQLKAHCTELGLDIRIVDTVEPNYVGRVYGDNLESYFSAAIPSSPAARDANLARDGISLVNGKLVYVPNDEESVALVKHRLGKTVQSAPDLDGNVHDVGAPGAYFRTSRNMAYKQFREPDDDIARGTTGASYASSTNNMAEYKTIQVNYADRNGRVGESTIPVGISTRTASQRTSVSIADADTAYATLEEYMLQARANFSSQVFGSMQEEIEKSVPNYKKDSWTSYRKTPRTEEEKSWERDSENYLIDPSTGERVIWRESNRRDDLKAMAGQSSGDVSSIKISHDPAVAALQTNYISYIENDDAILRGLVDGKIVNETAEDFARRVSVIAEADADAEEIDDATLKLLDAVFGDAPTYTHEEKLDHVQQHFGVMGDTMFGSIDENGVMHLNVANIVKYGGYEEKDVFRLLQAAKGEHQIDFVSTNDEFTMNRLRENIATFDKDSAKSLLDPANLEGRDAMKHFTETMQETFRTSGCNVSTLEVDDKGIVHYVVERSNSDSAPARGNQRKHFSSTQIEGYIGQIFEPDERGVIITKYDNDANRAIVPGYKAIIVPGEGSVESRTILKGYEQVMDDMLRKNIRSQISVVPAAGQTGEEFRGKVFKAEPTDTLNATSLNGIYRHMNSRQFDVDYMREIESKGLDEMTAEIYVEQFKRAVRYDSYLSDESTIRAVLAAKKSTFVDDVNTDGYSLTHRDISCLQDSEPGYFDPIATSGSTVQGIVRYLSEGAEVRPDGRIIPTNDEDKMNSPMMNLYIVKNGKYDPFDRQQMVQSNLNQMLELVPSVNTAYVATQGFTMDDPVTMSKEFAESHLVPSHDPETTKHVDAKLIENLMEEVYPNEMGMLYKFKGVEYQTYDVDMMEITDGERTALVPIYADMTSPEDPHYGWTQVADSEVRKYTPAEQVKARMIEDGIGIDTMIEANKVCDGHGNKGVTAIIVDRNMSDEEADAQGLRWLRDLYRLNPELEMTQSYPSSVSRFNGGTVRDAMFPNGNMDKTDNDPLNLPDGRVIEHAIAHIPMIITDKTADVKTHVYDDEDDLSSGRKASSQLAWAFQARGANKALSSLYADNDKAWVSIREKLLVLGCDIDENYNMRIGYQPHTLPDGTKEERPHLAFDASSIDVKLEPITDKNGLPGYKVAFDAKAKAAAVDDLKAQLAASGGMLELPFPLNMGPEGVQTQYDPDTGKYLLPVLPVQYRTEQSYDDGGTIAHKYTRQYSEIIDAVAQYELDSRKIEAEKKAKAENPDVTVNGMSAKGDGALEDSIRKAQAAYDVMKRDLEPQFEGSNKHNLWKHAGMSHTLAGRSATGVVRPNPNLDMDEIMMSAETAKRLNLREGDYVNVFRDPQLRGEGNTMMRLRIAKPGEPQTPGFAINPVADKRFDGDFDGDTFGAVNLRKLSLQERDFVDAYNAAEDEASKKAVMKEYGIKNQRNVDEILKQNAIDEEVVKDAVSKMGFVQTMCDLGTTPDNPKSTDEIHYALNLGLDVASGYAYSEELAKEAHDKAVANGDKVIPPEYAVYKTTFTPDELKNLGVTVEGTYDKDGKTYGIMKASDMEEAAKKATLSHDNQTAFRFMNDYTHEAMRNAAGSDYLQFGSFKEYFTCMNRIVQEHKVKGSLNKLEDLAAYLNIRQTPFDPENPNAPRLARTVNEKGIEIIDVSVPFKDYAEPPIKCNGKNGYYMEVDGVRTHYESTPEHIKECELIREDAETRYRQVELATAIKSFGTGTAGAFSQRGVKGCRNECICDLLEVTYGATQGLLQAKHSAVEAEQKFAVLTDALPALWKGQRVQFNEESQRFEVMVDATGSPVYATREDWVKDYKAICDSKCGLDFPIADERLKTVANALYDDAGKKMVIKVYDKNTGCTLDRMAYGGNIATVYDNCRNGAKIFDTPNTEVFKPDKSIVSEIRTVSSKYEKQESQVYVSKSSQVENESSVDVATEAAKAEAIRKEREARVAEEAAKSKENRQKINQANAKGMNVSNTPNGSTPGKEP